MSNQLEHLNAVYDAMCAVYNKEGMSVEELVYALAANLGKVIGTAQGEGCKYTPQQLRLFAITTLDGGIVAWGGESEAA